MTRGARWARDVSELLGIRPDRGAVTPRELFAVIERRFDPCAPLHVADSHKHALAALQAHAPEGGVRVIHFDAHHDLGYNPTHLADERAGYYGGVSCESWLYWAIQRELIAELVIVYPDWLDRAEGGETDPTHLLSEQQAERVHWTTWTDWKTTSRFTADWAPDTCGVFLARSGWWSPPWLDGEFAALADRFLDAGAQLVHELDEALTPRRHAPLRPAAPPHAAPVAAAA